MGYSLVTEVNASYLSKVLELNGVGSDFPISSVSSIDNVISGSIIFSRHINSHWSGIFLVTDKAPEKNFLNKNFVVVSENPRLTFSIILNYLIENIGFDTWDFSSSIHPSAKVGLNVVIEDGCIIGSNTIIEHNVVIHSGTRIGSNCLIRSGSVIGSSGFGFERLIGSTKSIRFPHIGGVLIGNDVEIGSLTAIAKGALGDTVIEDNVRVDNLVHIAHNCTIKKGAFIVACAEISGGVVVGENAWVAPNSCTHQKLIIGSNSILGLGAVLTKSMDDNVVYAGNPAKLIRRK